MMMNHLTSICTSLVPLCAWVQGYTCASLVPYPPAPGCKATRASLVPLCPWVQGYKCTSLVPSAPGCKATRASLEPLCAWVQGYTCTSCDPSPLPNFFRTKPCLYSSSVQRICSKICTQTRYIIIQNSCVGSTHVCC